MQKNITIILCAFFISCSTSKIEKQIINDFLKKEFITDKYIKVLVEEAAPKTKALQYYENAYHDRNLYEGEIRFAPNGYPPYNWEIDSVEIDFLKQKFRDVFLMDWQDRAISFDLAIIEDGELYTVSLYLSVLIPFYVIKIQKNKIELIYSKVEIAQMKNNNLESRKIKDLIIDIASIVESKMLYKKFPEELMNVIIKDVSFQEIRFGKFNMFNAFFNNLIIDEIKNNNTTDV